MWKNITTIKKNKYVIFNNNEKIFLPNFTKNVKWVNSKVITGINYISPKDKVFSCDSYFDKIDDNNYVMKMISTNCEFKNETNKTPIFNINHSMKYIDMTFCLRRYVYRFNRPWRGFDDAYNRIKNLRFHLYFYVNEELIATINSNTRGAEAHAGDMSVIVYDDSYKIQKPMFRKLGSHYKVNHTNSVDYYIDLGADIQIYKRGVINNFNFKAELSIDGYISKELITSNSFVNISYLYDSSTNVTSEGTAIFYEER